MSAPVKCNWCGKLTEDLGIHYGVKDQKSPDFCPRVASAFDDDYWPYSDKSESAKKRRGNSKKVKQVNRFAGNPITYSIKQLGLKGTHL